MRYSVLFILLIALSGCSGKKSDPDPGPGKPTGTETTKSIGSDPAKDSKSSRTGTEPEAGPGFDPNSLENTQKWFWIISKQYREAEGNPVAQERELKLIRVEIEKVKNVKIRWVLNIRRIYQQGIEIIVPPVADKSTGYQNISVTDGKIGHPIHFHLNENSIAPLRPQKPVTLQGTLKSIHTAKDTQKSNSFHIVVEPEKIQPQ